MSIHLIIIGAGLAGLSAGISTKIANPEHQVTILESVKELAEVGVGSSPSPFQSPFNRQILNRSHLTGRTPTHPQCNPTFQTMGHLCRTQLKSDFPHPTLRTPLRRHQAPCPRTIFPRSDLRAVPRAILGHAPRRLTARNGITLSGTRGCIPPIEQSSQR